jgi:hypothetical protein
VLYAAGTHHHATSYPVNTAQSGRAVRRGYTTFDLKLGKNLRFANKRLNIGVDIYNLFNNDQVIRTRTTSTP